MQTHRFTDAACFLLVMASIIYWGMSAPGGM